MSDKLVLSKLDRENRARIERLAAQGGFLFNPFEMQTILRFVAAAESRVTDLTRELAMWRSEHDPCPLSVENERLEARVAKLELVSNQLSDLVGMYQQEGISQRAEVTRLRAALGPVTEEWVRSQRPDWGIEGVVNTANMLTALLEGRRDDK